MSNALAGRILTREPSHLLDPEYVIPSASAKSQATFWERMLELASDRSAKLGAATLEALQELVLAPPPTTAITQSDFWHIITQYMSRGFTPSSSPRTICQVHIMGHYRPVLGDAVNVRRLIADATSNGGPVPLVLTTPPEVWPAELPDCTACNDSLLVRATGGTSETSVAQAWRNAFTGDPDHNLDTLREASPLMFPRINFHANAWNRVNSLEGDAIENIPKLVHQLGVLNDQAAAVWTELTESNDRQQALGSLGVTASPESPNTRRSPKKMRKRDFDFGRTTIRCEWHTKLRPNVNRIHFAIVQDKVYVGTIVDHLEV